MISWLKRFSVQGKSVETFSRTMYDNQLVESAEAFWESVIAGEATVDGTRKRPFPETGSDTKKLPRKQRPSDTDAIRRRVEKMRETKQEEQTVHDADDAAQKLLRFIDSNGGQIHNAGGDRKGSSGPNKRHKNTMATMNAFYDRYPEAKAFVGKLKEFCSKYDHLIGFRPDGHGSGNGWLYRVAPS